MAIPPNLNDLLTELQGVQPISSPEINTPDTSTHLQVRTTDSLTNINGPSDPGNATGTVPILNQTNNPNGVGPSANTQTTIQQIDGSGEREHPHLNENLQEPIRELFNEPTTNVDSTKTDAMLKLLGSRISDGGKFNLVGLKTPSGEEITQKMLKEAGISIKVFNNNGEFNYEVSGKCGDAAAKCLDALQNELNRVDKEVNGKDDPNYHPTFNLMADVVRNPSPADTSALGRGGQIQYRSLGDQMVKLLLDPGENGKDDSLSISLCDRHGNPMLQNDPYGVPMSVVQKIPLNVVFEGAELNGHKVLGENGRSILPNWRDQQLFEKSTIHQEGDVWTHKIRSTNIGDAGRIQAQNTLWNAVNVYLKQSIAVNENHFTHNNINQQTPTANPQLKTMDLKLKDVYLDPNKIITVQSKTEGPDQETIDALNDRTNTMSELANQLPNMVDVELKHIDFDFSQNQINDLTNMNSADVDIPKVNVTSAHTTQPLIEREPSSINHSPNIDVSGVTNSSDTKNTQFMNLITAWVDATQQKNTDELVRLAPIIVDQMKPPFDFDQAIQDTLKQLSDKGKFTKQAGEFSQRYVQDSLNRLSSMVNESNKLKTILERDSHLGLNAATEFSAKYGGFPGYQEITQKLVFDEVPASERLKNHMGL